MYSTRLNGLKTNYTEIIHNLIVYGFKGSSYMSSGGFNIGKIDRANRDSRGFMKSSKKK